MAGERLAEFCVYTIRHSRALEREAAAGGRGRVVERKIWRTARKDYVNARRQGEGMPILFGDAEGWRGIVYWATITDIDILEEEDGGPQTQCEYERLRPIDPPRRMSEVFLRNVPKQRPKPTAVGWFQALVCQLPNACVPLAAVGSRAPKGGGAAARGARAK